MPTVPISNRKIHKPDSTDSDSVSNAATTGDNSSEVQATDPLTLAAAGSTETVTLAGSQMVFVNTYGTGVSAAFKSAIITAENFFQSHFSNAVTLNMSFDLAAISNTFSGQNNYTAQIHISYATLVAALQSHATTADDLASIKALPAQDPSGDDGFAVPMGAAINLGLVPSTTANNDSVVLNSNYSWTFGDDAVGVLEHEISEGALGRIGGLGVQNGWWGVLDLLRFSGPNQHDYTGGQDGLPTYFSVDGTTMLLPFHNALNTSGVFDNQDFADWDGSVHGDAFGPSGPSAPGTISATDLRVMDILGWTPIVSPPSPPTNFTVVDTTTNSTTTSAGDTYTGPVSGLQHQFIDITPDSLNITASVPNSFIHSGSGTDGIDVSKANGNNIVDGSTGSNFLIGGTGNDTFYLDDRNPAAPVFSTIVNFHQGDSVTVWGVNAADFKLVTLDNQGAAGATGLDYVFTAPGHIDTSFVLAGYTSADMTNGRLTAAYGTTANLPNLPGSQYMTLYAT
jgi:hypothetical protein